MKIPVLILSAFVMTALYPAHAQDLVIEGAKRTITLPAERIDLRPGPGLERVQINCLACHSSDYIAMQPRFTRIQWTAEVAKMIKVFGARIDDGDAKIVSDYLAENYGAGR